MFGIELVIMVLMIGINGFLASYEIALASITVARLRRISEEGHHRAKTALFMKENMEASLAVVQLGITLVGVIAAAVGGAGAEEKIAPILVEKLGISSSFADLLALILVVIPLTIITIIFGELIPKVFALRNPERVALALSPLMRWFSFFVWPAVWLFEFVVKQFMSWGERRMSQSGKPLGESAELQELRATAALARASRLIGHQEESIILNAAEMQSTPVREIMLPAEHISTLDANASLADNLILAHLDMHTRFPVVETRNDPQTIIGYVNFKDLVAILRLNSSQATVRSIVRPIIRFQDTEPISHCLEKLLRSHVHIALVCDAQTRVVGMITLEDIVEELIGDIQDEYDGLPAHLIPSGNSWIVGGGATLGRIREQTGIELVDSTSPSNSISLQEWVTNHLQRDIVAGERIDHAGVEILVRKVRRNRIQESLLTRKTAG